ncbi:hypothetical protein AAMO2058_000058800 [Amorphochlora amoebiformis]|mmetsp:Transcript_24626/g.38856  ORF Transcript_24626/g.38856 Transcript_24626/m.38856 type:complete len:667 (-) Transcript_24626:41-2041(-)
MLNSRNQKRKAYSIEMSTNVPAEQAKKRRAENKIEIDLGFKLNVIKNGNYDINRVCNTIISKLGKYFAEPYKRMRRQLKKMKLNRQDVLTFHMRIYNDQGLSDVSQKYFSFRTCVRTAFREYFALTRKEELLEESILMPTAEEKKMPETQVVASLESTKITFQWHSIFHASQGSGDAEVKAVAEQHQLVRTGAGARAQHHQVQHHQTQQHNTHYYQAHRQIHHHVSNLRSRSGQGSRDKKQPSSYSTEDPRGGQPSSTQGSKRPRYPSSRGCGRFGVPGVRVSMKLQLGPIPTFEDQQSLMNWAAHKTQTITDSLRNTLHIREMQSKLEPEMHEPKIWFPNALSEALAHWESVKDYEKHESRIVEWTLTFKFDKEKFFRQDEKIQDYARCELLSNYCMSILTRHGITFKKANTKEGCIICMLTTFASEIPKVFQNRLSILKDFKQLVLEDKIKCMPTVSVLRNYKPRPPSSIIQTSSKPRFVDVVIQATYPASVFMINQLLQRNNWKTEIFEILCIKAHPMHSHILQIDKLPRNEDCFPTLKNLTTLFRKFCKGLLSHRVTDVLTLVIEYWAFDFMPRNLSDLSSAMNSAPIKTQAKVKEKSISRAGKEALQQLVQALRTKPEHHPANIIRVVDKQVEVKAKVTAGKHVREMVIYALSLVPAIRVK